MTDQDDLFESIRAGLPSVTNVLYHTLRRAIIAGQFSPGERLVEREISQRSNVSRTPIREAFRMLASEGLVRHTPRRGVEVVGLHTRQIEDVFAIRQVLEGLAAERAAVRASREDLSRMGSVVAEAEAVTDHLESFLATQDRFNALLAKSAHMPLLEGMLNLLQDYLREFRTIMAADIEHRRRGTAEHRAIYEALAARDPERAKASAARHVEGYGQFLLSEVAKTRAQVTGAAGDADDIKDQ